MRSLMPGSQVVGWSVLVLLVAAAGARAADREVRGRVVDEAGRPVADAAVGCFWRANGPSRDTAGKPYDLTRDENVRAFWGHLGQMEPAGTKEPVRTGAGGRFSLAASESYPFVMAMDRERRRGGVAVLPKGKEGEPVEIRVGPLVRVRGSFEGPGTGQRPYWTHVYVHVPEDPTRPLDSTRLVSCGSFDARFAFSLPPGRYTLQAYSQFADRDLLEGELIPDRSIALEGDTREVDLGRLGFSPHRIGVRTMEAKAKEAGTWWDHTKHYGERPPRWHVTDARGVSKDVQLSDLRGKWVLVDFWGFGCVPCLKRGLPKLVKFYEDHKDQRDRFEILAICVDPDGEVKSMAEIDRRLEPIVQHVWGGKRLPFPVLLDPTFQTWERFGLSGMGDVLLFDPEGRLVKGDETALAEELRQAGQP
jgi:thiol-disulfide isomerase/thioredoxin